MFTSSNLANLFRGDGKSREMRETRELWDTTEAAWNASPLAVADPDLLAGKLIHELVPRLERLPRTPILTAIVECFYDLYRAEVIGPIDPKWDAIEGSVEVASEFRQLLPRRKRWALDFENMHRAWKETVLDTAEAYVRALPESCFDKDVEEGDSFDVPLVDLLDSPATLVDEFFVAPYGESSMRLDLFKQVRGALSANMLVASGLPPNTPGSEVGRRMVRPTAQKNKTGAELAEMYLRDTPFLPLLDCTVPFRIPEELRFEHCHIVGGTGHGKTQLMQKLIHADLVASQKDGRSVVVIDSQGDLIGKLSRLDLFSSDAPDSLADKLVLIDPADVEFPAALNLFDAHLDRVRAYAPADRERVLNGVIELYELFFGAFLGAELTQKQGVIFKYLARLMLAIPNATIHTLMQVMEDGKPFKPYMDQLDGSARYFFETEFFHPAFAATKKQVLRRLWGVLSTPAFERMFTQEKNKLDLFEAMNEGKIVLVSTAKDLLKREGSQLLGRFFIAMVMQAALERSTLPERLRNPAFIYVDEAQEYFDDSIETILNQARKYRVGLTLAHQTLDQLSPRLRSAMLANTSMKCVGGVSAKDARVLSEELRTTPEFIEGMKRRGARTEFALWAKNLTGQAIRLSVPLGFLERHAAMPEEEYENVLKENRIRYCGTLATASRPIFTPPAVLPEEMKAKEVPSAQEKREAPPPPPKKPKAIEAAVDPASHIQRVANPIVEQEAPPLSGKGGRQHRYLQNLAKELAEQCGLKATIEAPLSGGQVDVLIERDGPLAAIEISVSTPVEWEKANLAKCLATSTPQIAFVLAKSKTVQASYRVALSEAIAEAERQRVLFLAPEQLPEFILSLAPPPTPEHRVVKGYRVKGSLKQTSFEEANARREAVARLIAKSFSSQK